MFFRAIKNFFNNENESGIGLSSINTDEVELEPIEDLRDVTLMKPKLSIRERLNAAKDCIAQLNLTEAYVKLSSIILELNDKLNVKNDRTHNYYSFSNKIEYEINFILESKTPNSFVQTRWVTADNVSYSEIFIPFISVLIESGKLKEAKEALKEAMRWNPVSYKIYSLYAEYFKRTNDLKNYEKYLLRALTLATSREDLTDTYMKLAFIKKKANENRLASALYAHASRFSGDIYRVRDANANGIELIDENSAIEILKQNGIQIEAGKIVQSALFRLMLKAKEQGDKTNFANYMDNAKSILVSKDKLDKLNGVKLPE